MPAINYHTMTLKELKETARVFDLKTLQDKASMEYRLIIHQKLIDEGPGIDKEQHRNELNDYTLPQLKAMLTYYHMKTTGSKKDLVRMLIELPIPKIDLPGKIPKSDTKKQETMKAMEDVTRLKKSIQDSIARVNALRDTFIKPVIKPMTPETDKFDSKRNDIIRLLEKIAIDPAKYQSDLSTITQVVNQLEKLATTSSHRKTIKRFRLILKKLLVVVPLEEALPSLEPKSKGIVINRPPVNKDVPKNITPVLTKLQTDIDELQSIGKTSQYNTKEFDPDQLLTEYIFLGMLSKYKNPAVIIDVKQKDPRFKPSPYRIGIFIEVSYKDPVVDFKIDVAYLGKQLKYYKNLDVDVICIPFSFFFIDSSGEPVGHANMLIYRPKLNTLEHFEPHGKTFWYNYDNMSDIIRNGLEKLWQKQLTKWIGKVEYIPSGFVCPTYDGLGPQAISEGGLCTIWSCFIAEFVLMNPTLTTPYIMMNVMGIINNDKTYAKNIIYGYIEKAEQFASAQLKRPITYLIANQQPPLTKHFSKLNFIKTNNPKAYDALISKKL
jgi:hypothetical protein